MTTPTYRLYWLRRLHPFRGAICIWWPWASVPHIYLGWKYTRAGRNSFATRATVAHEKVHVQQWLKYRRWKFLVWYLLSRKHRLDMEAEAIARSIKHRVAWYGENQDELVALYSQRVKGKWLTFAYGSTERWAERIRAYL